MPHRPNRGGGGSGGRRNHNRQPSTSENGNGGGQSRRRGDNGGHRDWNNGPQASRGDGHNNFGGPHGEYNNNFAGNGGRQNNNFQPLRGFNNQHGQRNILNGQPGGLSQNGHPFDCRCNECPIFKPLGPQGDLQQATATLANSIGELAAAIRPLLQSQIIGSWREFQSSQSSGRATASSSEPSNGGAHNGTPPNLGDGNTARPPFPNGNGLGRQPAETLEPVLANWISPRESCFLRSEYDRRVNASSVADANADLERNCISSYAINLGDVRKPPLTTSLDRYVLLGQNVYRPFYSRNNFLVNSEEELAIWTTRLPQLCREAVRKMTFASGLTTLMSTDFMHAAQPLFDRLRQFTGLREITLSIPQNFQWTNGHYTVLQEWFGKEETLYWVEQVNIERLDHNLAPVANGEDDYIRTCLSNYLRPRIIRNSGNVDLDHSWNQTRL